MSETQFSPDQGEQLRLAERKRRVADNLARTLPSEETLATPFVDNILADGSIPLYILDKPIKVNIPPWTNFKSDTIVNLYIDNEVGFVSSLIVESSEQFNPVLEMEIPIRFFTSGSHQIFYVLDTPQGYTPRSYPLNVIVDKDAPQALLPATLPESYNNTITRENLDDSGGLIPLIIPGYFNMEVDDTVELYWLGYLGYNNVVQPKMPVYTVTEQDVADNKITINVPETVITGGGDGYARIYYYLTDRTGNRSGRSPDYTVFVVLSPAADNLKAPYIPLAVDSVINDEDTREPVYARIPVYDNILPGDRITLYWQEVPISPQFIVPIPVPAGDYVVDIPVPRATIWDIGSGTWEVDYLVQRGPAVATSPALTVTVDLDIPGPPDPDLDTNENEQLLPLTIFGNGSHSENALLPVDLGKGATASVPWYETPKEGEIIRVYWGGRNSTSFVDYTVTAADVAQTDKSPFIIDLPAEIVDQAADSAEWEATYELRNATNINPGMVTRVTVRMQAPGGPDGLGEVDFLGKNTRGWLIEGASSNPSTSVFIAIYDNMKIGDIATLHWVGNTNTNGSGEDLEDTRYEAEIMVAAQQLVNGITFSVPHSPYIKGIGYGSASAYYTINQLGFSFDSKKAILKVDMEVPGS